ncbi:MAG: 2-keto-4-pentenoate hydratase [Pseudomonadota bacterium]
MSSLAHEATVRDTRIAHISNTLVNARWDRRVLSSFPGELPTDLDEAYAVQDRSISHWDDDVVAWKVGGIPPDLRPVLGQDWVTGPIYSKRQRFAGQAPVDMAVFDGGFAAVEAEIVLEFGDLSRLHTASPTADEIVPFIAACYIGVEIASSPMPDINVIGPLAVISDFGNNHGMIVGRRIEDWSPEKLSSIEVKTFVEGELVGTACPPAPPAGPMGAAAFLVENLKRRGRSIPAGLRVSSGALTGIHDVLVGQRSTVTFSDFGEIDMNIVALKEGD